MLLFLSPAPTLERGQGDVVATAAALQAVLAGRPVPSGPIQDAGVWTDTREFYRQRAGTPAWISSLSTSARTIAALQVLRTAPEHGLVAADYGEPEIDRLIAGLDLSDLSAPDRPRALASLDVRLTAALFRLGRDVAIGRTTPERVSRQWKARRTPPDFVGTLTRAAEYGLNTWLDTLRPGHPEYAALQTALAGLRVQEANGGWPRVPPGTFKAGTAHPAVIVLRQRLAADGYLTGCAAACGSPMYDSDIQAAVRALQERHGLTVTGIVDDATRASMNVAIHARIAQVEINLERWRWMPDDFGERHLLVNIPAYRVFLRESGQITRDLRVIVGKRGHETPVFSGDMTTVVLSPYWNIPDSIVVGETSPAVARDPEYLAKNNIQILRATASGMTVVDPAEVNWDSRAELRGLAFRQRPGSTNALGHVKFLFPNQYNVYLHDTPADKLFARSGRAFSHGCIRVDAAEALAQYILKDEPEWNPERILATINAGVETPITLRRTIPVHVVYVTAWLDDAGGLNYRPDVYGFDARQTRQRTGARVD